MGGKYRWRMKFFAQPMRRRDTTENKALPHRNFLTRLVPALPVGSPSYKNSCIAAKIGEPPSHHQDF